MISSPELEEEEQKEKKRDRGGTTRVKSQVNFCTHCNIRKADCQAVYDPCKHILTSSSGDERIPMEHTGKPLLALESTAGKFIPIAGKNI